MLRNENPFKNYFLGASLVFGFAVALAFTGAVVVVTLAGALALAGAFGAASLAGAAGFSAFGAPVALSVLPPAAVPVRTSFFLLLQVDQEWQPKVIEPVCRFFTDFRASKQSLFP